MNRRLTGIVALILLAALGSPATTQSLETSFVVNFLPTDISFDPITSYTTSEAQVFTALFEGLVGYDPYTLDPVPAAAGRWEILDEGTRYRFYIRANARYSNGDPVLAHHFRDTWLRLLDPESEAPYASLLDVVVGAEEFRTGRVDDPSTVGVRVTGDRVLEVELTQRATHFLRILCHHSFVALHPDVLHGVPTDPRDMPVNGPYTLVSVSDTTQSGGEMVLVRNSKYWDRDRLGIDRLVLQFRSDHAGITADFNRGALHWVRGGIDIAALDRRTDLVVNPLFATTYYQLSTRTPPFDDPRVRRAFALALPWDDIRSADAWFLPATSLVPALPAYPEVAGMPAQDLDAAKSLLSDAGYAGGAGLPEIVISIPAALAGDLVARLMIETWEEHLGARVRVEVIPYPGYFDHVSAGDAMVSTISWIGDFADPLTFLDMWTSESNLNSTRFADAEFDRLIRSAVGMVGNERYRTLSLAEGRLLADGVVLPISHSPSINLIALDLVDGWYANPLDIHPFKYLGFATGTPVPNVARM